VLGMLDFWFGMLGNVGIAEEYSYLFFQSVVEVPKKYSQTDKQ